MAWYPMKNTRFLMSLSGCRSEFEGWICTAPAWKTPSFLSNPKYRPSLLIHRLNAKFRFSLSAMDEHCVISLAFTDFNNGQNRDSEIELRIKKIDFDEARRGLDKNEAKQTILKVPEFEKIEMFKRLAKLDEAA